MILELGNKLWRQHRLGWCHFSGNGLLGAVQRFDMEFPWDAVAHCHWAYDFASYLGLAWQASSREEFLMSLRFGHMAGLMGDGE